MDLRQAVLDRYSVRSYQPGGIETGQLEQIKSWLIEGEKPPFSTPVSLYLLESKNLDGRGKIGTYGTIKGAEIYLAGSVAGDTAYGLEDFAFLFERMILKITSLALGSCWLGASFKRGQCSRFIDLEEGQLIPAISPVGVAAEHRSLRETLTQKLMHSRRRKSAEELFFDQTLTRPLVLDDRNRLPFELVRLAPSAMNRQPWRIVREGKRFHFYRVGDRKKVENGAIDLARLDMGIAMCHFDIGARSLGWQGEWVSQDPWLAGVPRELDYRFSFAM